MSPHEILGVKPGASAEEIRRAYHSKAKKLHPDHGGRAEDFVRLRAAYETLTGGAAESDAEGMRRAASLGYDAGKRAGEEILGTRAGKRIAGAAGALGIEDVPQTLAKGGAAAGARLFTWLRSKADGRRG